MTGTTTAIISSSRGLLLRVLMLVAVAQETKGFSPISRRLHLHISTLQHDYRSWRSSRRRLATQASTVPTPPFFWATIEQTPISSFGSNGEEDDDSEDIQDDDVLSLDIIMEASEGMSSEDVSVSPMALSGLQNSNNRHPSSWNNNVRSKKPKNLNPAMGDPAFLRKRTEKLLSLPADSALDNTGNDPHTISSRGMKVSRNTFHFLIDAWAFSGEMDAAEQAIALLTKMEELSFTMPSTILPDVRSYTKVINAISRSASPKAGEMAEDLLDKMNYLYNSGENLAVKPNTYTYTAVVEAYANSGVPGSAQHAEELCEVMIQKYLHENDPDVVPTARSFNAAINAYAKIGDAQRADDLFRRMEGVYMETGLEQVKPNAYNYNSLISAWASCGMEGAAQRAEGLLERMEAAYTAGNEEMKPTTVTYNAVIDAYSKVAGGHAGQQQYIYGGSSSQEYYNADETGEKAEKILRHMEHLYLSGENVDAKPNVRSYNTVINVWAKSQSDHGAKRAEEILDLMGRMVEGGDISVAPDVHSFSTVINAWARSQKQNKAERALNLLKEMKQLYKEGDENLRPNVVVANAVMNACAFTTGEYPERNRAMEIAHKVLKDLELGEYGKPDQVTYGTFLKVCANQMPECSTREKIVEMIFQKCRRDGQVGNMVLQQLRAITSPEKYWELIGFSIDAEHVMEDLPHEWWCNVVEGKWRRKRQY